MEVTIPRINGERIPLEYREDFLAIDWFADRYEEAFRTKMDWSNSPQYDLAVVASDVLLCLLQRMRFTCWGLINGLNQENTVVAALCARSMFEITATTAFLRRKLLLLYRDQLSRDEVTNAAVRLRFSTRDPKSFDLNAQEFEKLKSINVLTMIEDVEAHLVDYHEFGNSKDFRRWYDRLCEFTHPNGMSLQSGTNLDMEGKVVQYLETPFIHPGEYEMLLRTSIKAQWFFAELYNDSWTRLSANEQGIPAFEPSAIPLIDLEK